MDRLTHIDRLGWYATATKGGLLRGAPINRLAAYEDPGLEPEEVSVVAEMFGGEPYIPISRIAKLVEAERAGRLVVQTWCPGDDAWIVERDEDEEAVVKLNTIDSFVMVNPSTVGQYTGMEDKNGKKVFEGDIVRT